MGCRFAALLCELSLAHEKTLDTHQKYNKNIGRSIAIGTSIANKHIISINISMNISIGIGSEIGLAVGIGIGIGSSINIGRGRLS